MPPRAAAVILAAVVLAGFAAGFACMYLLGVS